MVEKLRSSKSISVFEVEMLDMIALSAIEFASASNNQKISEGMIYQTINFREQLV